MEIRDRLQIAIGLLTGFILTIAVFLGSFTGNFLWELIKNLPLEYFLIIGVFFSIIFLLFILTILVFALRVILYPSSDLSFIIGNKLREIKFLRPKLRYSK